MLYYSLMITNPAGDITNMIKITHNEAMLAINNTILEYGFSKGITKDTFHNILCRPKLLPERLKWLMNNNKICVTKTNQPNIRPDIIKLLESMPVN